MDLRTIDLNLLVVMDALHRERNVTSAARRLGVRQPAVSEALAKLRVLFDDALYVRAGGAMQSTPRADAIILGVQAALETLRTTLGDSVAFAPALACRDFIIASTDYTSAVLLPAIIAAIRRDAPNINLRIIGYDKDEVGLMLDRGEADLALGVFPEPPAGAVKTSLFTERFIGVARRDHPALGAGESTPEVFAGWPQALVSVRRDARGALDKSLAQKGLRRRIAVVVPHMAALPAVLLASDLVAALPARLARDLDHRLGTFELPVSVAPWEIEMLWNPNARRDQATSWLRRLVKSAGESV